MRDGLRKIALESFLSKDSNCLEILGREKVGNLSDSDLEIAYPIFDNVVKIEQVKRAEENRIEYELKQERLRKLPSIVEINRELFKTCTPTEKKITKSFLNKFINHWSNSRYGVRKADVINEILNFRNSKKDARMYCSATYTEKSGCHGYKYNFYVDYEMKIIALVESEKSDCFDFTPYRIKQIIEIYTMV